MQSFNSSIVNFRTNTKLNEIKVKTFRFVNIYEKAFQLSR